MSIRDEVIPGSRWAFDQDVTDAFEDMLARSIPQYTVMRKAVTDVALRFMQPRSHVLDLGCSRGEALAPLIVARPDCQFIGLEVSPPMLDAARQRFLQHENVKIETCDLRHDYPRHITPSVVLSVLTLQFVPIEYRQGVLQRVYRSLPKNGAFILVEKVLGATADLDAMMVARYYDMKGANGYTAEQIERKRLSLEGVLVPMTARFNEDLLRTTGFKQIDCFWRWMNFCAWVAIKE